MRLLLFSDLHAEPAVARRLALRAAAVDLLVGAGDFADMRTGLDGCIDVLRSAGKPAVLVAGNSETTAELREACRGWANAHVLHGTASPWAGTPSSGWAERSR